MDLTGDQHKVAENNVCEFHVNSWTKGADKWASEWGLKNIRCLLAIQKSDKTQDYILLDKGEVVYSTTSYEAIATHIDIMALSLGLKREDSW